MKKYTLSLIATACALALTACSSSRGGNAVDSSQYLTQKPSSPKPTSPTKPTTPPSSENSTNTTKPVDPKPTESKPTEPTKPSEPEKPVQPTEKPIAPTDTPKVPEHTQSPFSDPIFVASEQGPQVGAVVTLEKNGTITGRNPINDGREELNELVLEGTRFLLYNSRDLIEGNGIDGFKTLSNQDVMKETPYNGKISGYVGGWGPEGDYDTQIFTNMRFGVLNRDNDSTLFVQGYQTPEEQVSYARQKALYPMPKSGVFLYKTGHALYGKEGNYQQLTAEVVADFTQKQLDVVLKKDEKEKLAFSAQIDKNAFTGKHKGIESKGAFYGSRANEVGGVFYQTEGTEKGKNGVFGAVDARPIRQ